MQEITVRMIPRVIGKKVGREIGKSTAEGVKEGAKDAIGDPIKNFLGDSTKAATGADGSGEAKGVVGGVSEAASKRLDEATKSFEKIAADPGAAGSEMMSSAAEKGYRLVGDVDFAAVQPVAGKITPNPGGVGPMTIAMLMRNTVRAAEQQTDEGAR